jgi:hypothetical protein
MKRLALISVAILMASVFSGLPVSAQNQSAAAPAPNEVIPGTRFLIKLDAPISTNQAKAGDQFVAHTIEPISSADGTSLRVGAEIRGHVDKVEAAHKTGHARMWLTFDDIKTPDGWLPIVAMLTDVPGVHSVRVDYTREGEIEASSAKRNEALEAAAAAALVGAAPGVASHNEKSAAVGAATGAVTAYMVTAGLGQDLTIDPGMKLEVTLERSLFFGRA